MFKNKNILIFKKKKYSSYYDNIVKGIIEFGLPNEIFYIEYDSNSNFVKLNQKINNYFKNNKVSIFILLSYYFIDPSILQKYKNKIYRIRIDGDDGIIFNHYSRWYSQIFDLNITTSLIAHQKYKSLGLNSILYANNLDLKSFNFKELSSSFYKYDISFVGLTNSIHRTHYLDYIKKNSFELVIFGEGTKNGKLSISEKYSTYRKSKINLNFSKVFNFDNSLLAYEPDLNNNTTMQGRIFEVLSAGGFLLSEYSPSIEYFFEIDKDLVVFRDEEEMIKKIQYYLDNTQEREKIAKNGRLKFQNNYAYSVYTPKFINSINSFKDHKNINNEFKWPIIIKNFNCRFIRVKYLYSLKYIIYIFRYFSLYLFFKNKLYNLTKKNN